MVYRQCYYFTVNYSLALYKIIWDYILFEIQISSACQLSNIITQL